MRYPAFIKKGDTIGFAAPSFGCSFDPYYSAFCHSLDIWKEKGYRTELGPNCFSNKGIGISNIPEKCAEEFVQMYCSSENQAVLSCGGGELMCEILPFIDFHKLSEADPKWFMGYSDNTNLTFLLTTLTDTASIYGPCAASLGMEPWHPSIQDAFELLQGKKLNMNNYPLWEKESLKDENHPFEPYNITETFKICRVPEAERTVIRGRLLGGCLDCLRNLAGTEFDRVSEFSKKYAEDGIIWFLESCELNPFDVRRALWQLKECGWFRYVKGFLVGRPGTGEESLMGLDFYKAVTGVLQEIGVPILMGLDIGHMPPMMPLINGARAFVTADSSSLHVQMELV